MKNIDKKNTRVRDAKTGRSESPIMHASVMVSGRTLHHRNYPKRYKVFEVLETVKDLCVNFIFQHISDLEKAKDVCLEFVSDFIFNRLTQEIKIEEQISNGAGTWHISMQAHVPNKYVRDKKSRSKLIGRLRDDIREAIVE